MSDLGGIALTLVLLLANAFFVGAEFSLISARRSVIEPKALEGNWAAKVTISAMEQVSLMMAGAQLGITVCSLALGAISEPAIAHLLEVPFGALGIPEGFQHPIAFAIALSLVTYLHVVFGEMVPKNISIAVPVGAVCLLAPPLVVIARIFTPVIWILNVFANGILRLLRVEPRDEVESEFTAEEIAAIVDESRREGLLEDDQGLLRGAIQFSEHTARDVMVPISEVVTVTHDVSPAQIEEIVARTGYSRIGVRNDAGDLVGYVHLKDVLLAPGADDADYERPIPPGLVRAVVSVDDEDEIEEALRAMQYNGAHMARVDSPTSRSVGVVFLEDVLEELVGEVKDVMQRHRV